MVKKYTYLEVYLDNLHKKVSLTEFEKHFKTPHQTIKKHLKEFIDAKILTLEKKARFTFYSLNLTNPLVREYLAMCEKERLIFFLKKPLFKRLYEHISEFLVNSKVALFGSSINTEHFSDIDLLVISKDEGLRKAIDNFINTYSGTSIHVVQTDAKHLTASFITEIKKQHIFLTEHDYFIRELYKHELRLV
jgi:predicted nucleotidyltransferase